MVRRIVLTMLDADKRQAVLVKKVDRELPSARVLPIETPTGKKINAVVIGVKKYESEYQIEVIHMADEKLADMLSLLKSDGWMERRRRPAT